MPIIKYKDVTLHFAHIPKCAGSSIENYVKRINGAELAFVDISYVGNPAKKPWNISSPQHIDGASFARLFPKTFFDAFFYPKTGYQLFKLEQGGVKAAKKFIDKQLFGNDIVMPVPHANAAKKSNDFDESDLVLSDQSIEIIVDAYQRDYERFSYPLPKK